jgi:hypothetical protein
MSLKQRIEFFKNYFTPFTISLDCIGVQSVLPKGISCAILSNKYDNDDIPKKTLEWKFRGYDDDGNKQHLVTFRLKSLQDEEDKPMASFMVDFERDHQRFYIVHFHQDNKICYYTSEFPDMSELCCDGGEDDEFFECIEAPNIGKYSNPMIDNILFMY